MSITNHEDLAGIKAVSEAVGVTLKKMRDYAQPGMSTLELDEYGYGVLKQYGANPAPKLVYGFPGYACISVNHEIAHGIPSAKVILKEGDLVNVDVSAELNGYYADNGGSFILGQDVQQLGPLVEASKRILQKAIQQIKGGVKISEVGRLIETEAKKAGYKVIRNLVGHGVGRSLHEEPSEIPNYYDRFNTSRFKKNSVVAIETFISTKAALAQESGDGWTYVTKDGSFVAQHEHTILVTDGAPIILTEANQIWS
ncbi:type I methionyl aminopeptidase [Rufibacter immobilis]|uniref:type I methionyl aminopeptidase n=1 Tax=Rufibacter immobilis TaxID=1348778 RepID=UPI0035E4A84A